MMAPPPVSIGYSSLGYSSLSLRTDTGTDIAVAVFEPLDYGSGGTAVLGARPACLMLHGYGGCKEELFALALRISESHGMRCTVADLPGHGQSGGRFSLPEVRSALGVLLHAFHPELAVGHSVGARILDHLSRTPRLIAISPPLRTETDIDRRAMLTFLRHARVREESAFSGLRECLDHFGAEFGHAPADVSTDEDAGRRVLVLRAANDLESVRECVAAWSGRRGVDSVDAVPASNHIDVLSHPMTCERIREWLDAR